MGAQQSRPYALGAPGARRLLYTRDRAGWNNVRLTFETLVCVAALSGRQLVLPPPSPIEHLQDALFHELQVYDAPALAGVVDFASGRGEPGAATTSRGLREILRAPPAEADLVLDPDQTRIQHFECLGLQGEEAARAARAVLALELALPYREAALSALGAAGLRPGAFHGVHLRRGDFAAFRPETQWSGADLQGRVRALSPAEEAHWPLLVACCTAPGEEDPFPELAAALTERRVLRTDELYGPHAGQLHRAVVDTLMLAEAARFAGTPDSTFSTGVWHWRARARVLRGERPETPRGLAPLAPPGEDCWRRCSSFAALV